MIRADVLLVQRGLAHSRTNAQNLIEQGRVQAGDPLKLVNKTSLKLDPDVFIEIKADASDRYVSRGAFKLEGALASTQLDITGYRVLDVGQSTGGFTDCVLQAGASHVVGLDVGHNQLHTKIKNHPQVRYFEGVNARYLDPAPVLEANDQQLFDLMVCDVSFISVSLIYPTTLSLLKPGAYLLSLIKPQFEVGKEGVGRGGIVRDKSLYPEVHRKISQLLKDLDMTELKWMDSAITGGDGNREFFVFAQKN